jgi:hypothetical protein
MAILPQITMDYDQIPFIPGLELSELFYREAVRPILERRFPGLRYAAARLDYGSDVLGFDTPQSRDHGWGPKVTLFLQQSEHAAQRESLYEVLSQELPVSVHGYPTNYDQPFSGEAGLVPVEHGPVRPWVAVVTVPGFFRDYLGIDATQPLKVMDWLSLPPQHLRTVAAGKVFHDGWGELSRVRELLCWYPHDLWLYLLANQWRRIDQEEPFMARCGDVGDELGSRLVAARLVIELVKLCLLMERQYPPYYKWFGTAFSRLACASELQPVFQRVLDSQGWREREGHLSQAYRLVMAAHNTLGLTPTIEPEISPFFNRPYQVPHTARFVEALHAAIQSPQVRALPQDVGGVSQFVDSTDLLSDPHLCRKLGVVYTAESGGQDREPSY